MKINKSINLKNKIQLTRPLSYEYDSETESVVLLDGYKYKVVYSNSIRNLTQDISLLPYTPKNVVSSCESNMITVFNDFYYEDGLVWSIYLDDVLVGEVGDLTNGYEYMEDILSTGKGLPVVGEYTNSNLILTNRDSITHSITAVPNNADIFFGIMNKHTISVPDQFVVDMKTGVISFCLGLNDNSIINCALESNEAYLKSQTAGFDIEPTVDLYVNDILVMSNLGTTHMNQYWGLTPELTTNSSELNYYVYGDSSGYDIFYNSSSFDITFSFVPNRDGTINGVTVLARDALSIGIPNTNASVYKSPTGTISFCLKGSGAK